MSAKEPAESRLPRSPAQNNEDVECHLALGRWVGVMLQKNSGAGVNTCRTALEAAIREQKKKQ